MKNTVRQPRPYNMEGKTNDFHTNGTHTWYEVADANWGMYNSGRFKTIKEAKACIASEEYRTRSKGDDYDLYWQTIPLVILKVTKQIEVVHLDNPNS